MIRGFRIRPSSHVGLAVHHERLVLVRLRQTKKQIIIEKVASTALPAGTIADGKVNHLSKLADAIKKLVAANDSEGLSATLALPASQVINKRIRVAACLNNAERAVEIATHLKDYLPDINEQVYFDFIPGKKSDDEVELQFIAARAEQVEQYVHLAEAAGLKIGVMEVDINAVVRGVQQLVDRDCSRTIMILDRDVTTAQLVLLKQGKPVANYPIILGADEVVIQQVKTGLQIFSATESSVFVEKLVLTGYQSNVDVFTQTLQSVLQITVEKTRLPQQIGVHSALNEMNVESVMPEIMTAFGLALRGFF